MTKAVLSLGSNLGDRLALLQQAILDVAGQPRLTPVAVSGVYETDPVGGPDQPYFLNAVLVIDTTLTPRELLELAHAVEASADRERSVRWGPRTLDVDIIAMGDDVVDETDLQVPHPRAAERAFVLVPWSDADPTAVFPGAGAVRELLDTVDTTGVRPRPDLALELPA